MCGFQTAELSLVSKIFDLLASFIEQPSARSVSRKISAFAINNDPAFQVAKFADCVRTTGDAHVANLANQGSGLIIKQRDLRIRRFPAIIKPKPSANAQRPRRQSVLSQSPAAEINDMDPVIAHLTVARRPKPMPFVVQLSAHERPFRSRAAP